MSGAESSPRPVGLVGERLDVAAQQPGVIAQVLLALLLVARLVGVEDALKRRLGVHHDVLAARQADHEIRSQGRFVPGQGGLLDEVAVADHAGELDHVAQLHLAPLAARVGLAQRGDQRSGLGAQALTGLGQRLQLRLEPTARLASLLVEPQQLRVHATELVAQRGDQLLDRLLALVQIALGLRLRGPQLSPRELGELRHARLQRFGAQGLERGRQPLLGVGDRGQPLGRHRALAARSRRAPGPARGRARRPGPPRPRASAAGGVPRRARRRRPRRRPISNQMPYMRRLRIAGRSDGTNVLHTNGY